MTVHATDMRTRNPHQGMFDRKARHIFRLLNRLLNAADGLIEFGNYSLAQAARFRDAMAAITQSVLAQLRHEHGGLRTSYVNRGNEIRFVTCHEI